MRAESDWVTVVGVGRIEDKTLWTKAVGEAVTVAIGIVPRASRANIAVLVIV
jgi:hypothetical protein